MRSFSKNYLFFLVILIAPAILTCTKNPVGVVQYDWYPLAVGNSWEYTRFYAFVNLQSDTTCPLSYPGLDTLFGTGKIEVAKLDTLLDSIPIFELRDILVDSFGSYGGLTYYNNLEDGLYYYGYSGSSHFPPLKATAKRFYFKGKFFDNATEILDWLQGAMSSPQSNSGILEYYLPPKKRIQYPLRVGSQWTYSQAGDPWRIDGRVVTQELITVPAGRFLCYKIQWLYYFNDDGVWDSDIEFIDYISSIGMVKRSFHAKNIDLTDYCFGHPATIDLLDEFHLTGYTPSFPRLPLK